MNAFWFKLFGVSLTSLIVLNLAILAAVLAGIHHLLRISTDRLTATVATLSVMLLFGFSQYVETGNYNFVAPYAHEATHGIALTVAILIALYHGVVARRPSLFAVAGGCFGLLLLTKPETSLAASAAVVVGFSATTFLGPNERRCLSRSILAFLIAAAVPPLLFFAYFRMHMPANDALRAVGGAWTMALAHRSPTTSSIFAAWVSTTHSEMPVECFWYSRGFSCSSDRLWQFRGTTLKWKPDVDESCIVLLAWR